VYGEYSILCVVSVFSTCLFMNTHTSHRAPATAHTAQHCQHHTREYNASAYTPTWTMWFVIRVPVAIQDTSACTFASRGVTGVAPCTSNIVGIPPPSLGYLSLCHALLLERELAPE